MRKLLITTIFIFSCIQIFSSNCNYKPGKSRIIMCSEEGVTIGGVLEGCGGCVQWSPTTGLANPQSVQTNAKPEHTTVYTLEIYDDEFNFVGSDLVTVVVEKDKMITGIAAAPECCYKRGDPLNAQNLHITTTPPGLEENVQITPNSASDNFHLAPVISMEIELKNTCGDEDLIVNKTITVVDEDLETSKGTSYANFDDLIEEMEETIEKVNSTLERVEKLKFSCKGEAGINNGLKITYGKKCCTGKSGCSVKDNMKASGSVSVSGSFGCSADIPWLNIPYLSSFYLSAGISASLGVSINYDHNCGDGTLCIEAKPAVGLEAKVGYKVLDGLLLDVNIGPVVGIEVKNALVWCPIGNVPPSDPQLCINLAIEGSYTILSGFITEGFSYKIIQDKCTYL